MKFVISTKSGKAYSTSSDEDQFIGKKIGETIKLENIGLTGFEAVITGGSDKDGFPMNNSVQGPGRKKILTAKGLGFKSKSKIKGQRKRVSVRGNTISEVTAQVNLKITKDGTKKLAEIFGKEIPVSAEEEMSAKEKALLKSKELAQSGAIGDAPTKKGRH
ncbi:MAG: S6e family ribosomal protein [Candidatus ainarchaeum sp.]|nr:S6e family ribosomal protein [Candidatus ainarchaeum sp.]